MTSAGAVCTSVNRSIGAASITHSLPAGSVWLWPAFSPTSSGLQAWHWPVSQTRPSCTQSARGELSAARVTASRAGNTHTNGATYWLVRWPQRQQRPVLAAFEDWLLAQAGVTARTAA